MPTDKDYLGRQLASRVGVSPKGPEQQAPGEEDGNATTVEKHRWHSTARLNSLPALPDLPPLDRRIGLSRFFSFQRFLFFW